MRNEMGMSIRYVKPRPAWSVLLTYVAAGGLLGLLQPLLTSFAQTHLGRGGLANFALINFVLPLVVMLLSALYPRWWVAGLGAGLLGLAFPLCTGKVGIPFSGRWLATYLNQIGPIYFVASLVFVLLAVGTVGALRGIRRVGVPPDPRACRSCGYLLVGLTENRCPECGLSE